MSKRRCGVSSVAFALVLVLSAHPAAAQNTCSNTLIITGINNKGVPDKAEVSLTRVNYDYTAVEVARRNDEQVTFMGIDAPVADASVRYNCAGYVADRLWVIGQYKANVDQMATAITKFGNPVFPKRTQPGFAEPGFMETVKAGDIVIYGPNTHIAFVESLDPITIVGKDNEGAVFRYPAGSEKTDVLQKFGGEPLYYTLPRSRLTGLSKKSKLDVCGPCETGALVAPGPVEVSCPGAVPAADTDSIKKQAEKLRRDSLKSTGLGANYEYEWKTAMDIKVSVTEPDNGGSGRRGNPKVITRTYTVTPTCERLNAPPKTNTMERGTPTILTHVITVENKVPPKLTGTPPLSIPLKPSDRFPPPDTGSIHALDNCSTDKPQVRWIEDLLSRPGTGRHGDPRVVVRKYQVSDSTGNSIDVRQTITVEDDAAPPTERFESPSIPGGRFDWCAVLGDSCGQPAADAFCSLKGYARSVDLAKAQNVGRTKLVNGQDCDCVTRKCDGYTCDGFKHITCAR